MVFLESRGLLWHKAASWMVRQVAVTTCLFVLGVKQDRFKDKQAKQDGGIDKD